MRCAIVTTVSVSSVLHRAQGSVRVQRQLSKIRRRRSRLVNIPLQQVEHARRRLETEDVDVLLLGGLPIREPIVHYGPFLMNTREQILEAIDDFNGGRMGTVPATTLGGSS